MKLLRVKTEKNVGVKSETGKIAIKIIKKEEKKTEDKWMDQNNFEFNNIELLSIISYLFYLY